MNVNCLFVWARIVHTSTFICANTYANPGDIEKPQDVSLPTLVDCHNPLCHQGFPCWAQVRITRATSHNSPATPKRASFCIPAMRLVRPKRMRPSCRGS